MKQFMYGLVLGVGFMWGYYEWDSIVWQSKRWFAAASSAPEAEKKVDELFSR